MGTMSYISRCVVKTMLFPLVLNKLISLPPLIQPGLIAYSLKSVININMSLPTLPTELLTCIATHLLPSIQDVDSLAKASKIL
jgi:hypothetical protein